MQTPAPFDYERATSVDGAIASLGRHGGEARIIAGGHSLLPMMKLRLASPALLIDINDLEDELAYLGSCPWEDDLAFCREVCAQAGVPLEVVPLQREYHQKVVAWAIAELEAGRTPSPDVLCNQRIKFGAFLDLLDERCGVPGAGGFDRIASGHYARLGEEDGELTLLRGVDPGKDQTYFLFQLEQNK